MGNLFSYLFSFHLNAPKLFFRMEIWTFSFQNCFENQFLTLGSENMQISVFAYFQFDNFLKSKVDSESSFEMRRSIFLFYKNFGSDEKKKVIKWIFHCIFKNGFVQCRGLFSHPRVEKWYNDSYVCPEEPHGGEKCCL